MKYTCVQCERSVTLVVLNSDDEDFIRAGRELLEDIGWNLTLNHELCPVCNVDERAHTAPYN